MSPTADGASADLQQTVADLQRQLAEARAERDEFEAQKAALAEVLGIINSSPGDLTPVFDAILEKATRLCGVPYGQLALLMALISALSRYTVKLRSNDTSHAIQGHLLGA